MTSVRLGSLRDSLRSSGRCEDRFLWSASCHVCLADLLDGTSLGAGLAALFDRSVFVAARDQLAAALALVELDGIARQIVIGTPDLAAEHLPWVIEQAGVEAVVSDI